MQVTEGVQGGCNMASRGHLQGHGASKSKMILKDGFMLGPS